MAEHDEDGSDAERFDIDNRTIRYEMSSLNQTEEPLELEDWPDRPKWDEKEIRTVKFIDDFTCAEKLFSPECFNVFSTAKPLQFIRAKKCQQMYNEISVNGQQIGLKINCKKTQIICISGVHETEQHTYIDAMNEERIESQTSLKILGFHFGTKPTVEAHINELKKKYRRRAWIIRHLKRAGLDVEDLVKLYKALLRPVLDYASPIYHPMLNAKLSKQVEDLQRNTLKTIFGYDTSYNKALELSGLPTLDCLLYTSPSPRDRQKSRMPSSA